MSATTVSIIIPVFQDEERLKSTLDSIVMQSFSNWEVHIMDGANDAGTLKILDKFSNDKIHHHRENDKGIYDAMNKGIKVSNSKYLYFLGAGDKLADSFVLEEVFNDLSENSEIIFGNIEYENLKSKKVNPIHHSEFSAKLRWKNTLHHQGVFYRSSIFLENSYDTDRKILADYELNMILYLKETSSVYKDLIIAKCDGTGISKSFTWNLYKEELSIKKNLFGIGFYFLDLPWVLMKFLYKKT